MAEMGSLEQECVSLILKYLHEENLIETAHTLERQSGLFFNLEYVEELVMDGNWEELEKYLSGFTGVEDNKYSTKIFFEIRKQKYLEALDGEERHKAVEILTKDLKVFGQYNNDLYKEMALIITLEDFRSYKSLGRYGDTISARASILREIKKAVRVNPAFFGKLELPDIDTAVLRGFVDVEDV